MRGQTFLKTCWMEAGLLSLPGAQPRLLGIQENKEMFPRLKALLLLLGGWGPTPSLMTASAHGRFEDP